MITSFVAAWLLLSVVVAFLHCVGSTATTLASMLEDRCHKTGEPDSAGCALSLPRPAITYLTDARPEEAHIRLERGQTLTLQWPQILRVIVPDGVSLQILEATSQRIRVMAV